MGRSKSGGIFGFVKGKVAGKVFFPISAKNSASGKTEQGVRALPETVSNPQTVGQVMQRMKLAPAQKFYAAFSELLSNAFQGVAYGAASRRYFMSKVMKVDGPYVQKGVDRFIPAAYPFSQGSLPSVGINPFNGGATVITLAATTTAEQVTPAVLADALQANPDWQLTVVVVNNVNGIFQPSYIGFQNRLRIADLPANAIGKSTDGHITLNPAALGLDMSSMVACCIVLSTQDVSGNWLRSTQEMIISDELRNSLYSADALEAAIYSYQDTTTVNSVNSEWYYNLGMAQAWPGKLTSTSLMIKSEGTPANASVVIGLQQLDGRIVRTVFATSTEPDGLIICVSDNGVITYEGATVSEFQGLNTGYQVELWQDVYAQQLGFVGGGSVTPSPAPQLPDGSAYWRPVTLGGTVFKALVDSFGRLYTHEDENAVYGFAWSAEGEQLPDFDNSGRYSEAFANCYSNWGHNNKLVEFTGNTAIIEYDGQQIPLVYDEMSGEITPNVPQMTNGTPDIFIRTLNDGTADVKVLVAGDGSLLVHANSYFLVNSESGEITVEDDAIKLAALTEAAGVAVSVDEFVEDASGFFKIVNNGYTVIVNFDGCVTFGEVTDLVIMELADGSTMIPASIDYVSGAGVLYPGTEDEETTELNEVPVVVDTEGNKHVIVCGSHSSKFFGQQLGRNVPGGQFAWFAVVNVQGAGSTVSTGDYSSSDPTWVWMNNHGIKDAIFFDYD